MVYAVIGILVTSDSRSIPSREHTGKMEMNEKYDPHNLVPKAALKREKWDIPPKMC